MHAPAKRFQFLRVVGLIDPLVGRKLGRDSSPASIVSKPATPFRRRKAAQVRY